MNVMFVKYFITSFAVHVQKRNYSLPRQIAERRVLLLPPRRQLMPCGTNEFQVSNMQCKKCVKAVIHFQIHILFLQSGRSTSTSRPITQSWSIPETCSIIQRHSQRYGLKLSRYPTSGMSKGWHCTRRFCSARISSRDRPTATAKHRKTMLVMKKTEIDTCPIQTLRWARKNSVNWSKANKYWNSLAWLLGGHENESDVWYVQTRMEKSDMTKLCCIKNYATCVIVWKYDKHFQCLSSQNLSNQCTYNFYVFGITKN